MLSQKENESLELIKTMSSDDLIKTRDAQGVPYLKLVFSLYQKLFGEACSTCPNKIGGYITKLKKYNPNSNLIMSKSRYTLQGLNVIVVPGTSKAYSNSNLTDEVAIKFLASNAKRKALFSKLPKEVDEEIANFVATGEFPTITVGDETVEVVTKAKKLSKAEVKKAKAEAEKAEAEKAEAEKAEAEKAEAEKAEAEKAEAEKLASVVDVDADAPDANIITDTTDPENLLG